jgi:ankyrin repeat protein
MSDAVLEKIADGRTDLVFAYLAASHSADTTDSGGVSLIQHCAYYGDVSAIRHLVAHGAKRETLGDNIGLDTAAFHGHWQLCQYLIENGADADRPRPGSGETPLHAALCREDCLSQAHVVRILLAAGADPCRQTTPHVETGAFMRDVRTKGETPLHRAAAFGSEDSIGLLLEAGAKRDVKDVNGDTPLTWASWYQRPTAILQMLCYGPFRVHPGRTSMAAYLTGKPHT